MRQSTQRDSVDSSALIFKRDSLLDLKRRRSKLFYPDQAGPAIEQDSLQYCELFRSDATSWYDVPSVKRWAVMPKVAIAGSLNRLLLYGNTAPLTRIYRGGGLLYHTACEPLYSEDASFTTEYDGVSFTSDGSIRFRPFTDMIVSPETFILWENGVFDGNILTVRFSRPLNRSLSLNVFSNYRFFKDMPFSHDGNDVYTFFSNITADTTLLSHKGYNPLVNEYFCGADAVLHGKSTTSFFRIKYGDVTDEIPLDRKPSGATLDHARLQQYPMSFHSALSTHTRSRWFLDLEAYAFSNPQTWTYPVSGETARVATKRRLSKNDVSGAIRTGVKLTGNDTLSLRFIARHCRTDVSDSLLKRNWQYRPELAWSRPLSFYFMKAEAFIEGGSDFFVSDAETVITPLWSGIFSTRIYDYQLRAYTQHDILHIPPLYDSLINDSTLHETYLRTGIEIERKWRYFSLLVGYQWCTEIDTAATNRTWICGVPPYLQPQSVLIVAPQFGRWHGAALTSRVMISERKPYVKFQSGLSMLVFPKLTREAVDIRLETDFWSERDTILFAGRKDWNRYILDLNFAMSAHIRSFRLIYKIDNLLNRKFSYVPGYYSPGITFRWGFSWFIQR